MCADNSYTPRMKNLHTSNSIVLMYANVMFSYDAFAVAAIHRNRLNTNSDPSKS